MVFSRGGGEALAKSRNVPFLGALPIEPAVAAWLEDDDRRKGCDSDDAASGPFSPEQHTLDLVQQYARHGPMLAQFSAIVDKLQLQ